MILLSLRSRCPSLLVESHLDLHDLFVVKAHEGLPSLFISQKPRRVLRQRLTYEEGVARESPDFYVPDCLKRGHDRWKTFVCDERW